MTPVRVKVGCSLASGWEKPFSSIEKRAQQAGKKVQQGLSGGKRKGVGRGGRDTWSQEHLAAEKHATQATKSESQKRLADIRREMRERNREHRELLKEVEKEERRAARQQARIARERARQERRAMKERESFARRTSHRATRFFWPNAPVMSMARRGAMDIARGAGVETNFGSLMGRVVQTDKMARDLSIQAFREGEEGAAGQRVDPGKLREEARALGEEMSVATEEILRGQKAFVDLLGNLEGARALSPELARLARSQAVDFEDTMRAAGKIDSALASQAEYAGDVAKRNRVTLELMKGIVYQGKIGSITMEKMAKELPKLSGIANLFEGQTGRNIGELTAIAQLAERGPAKNAATASTYTQNFALALTKQASKFKEVAGVEVFGAGGKMRSLREIMTSTLAATEGTREVKVRGRGRVQMNQLEQLQTIMPNKRAFLAMQEFVTVFQGAGGGKAGVAAVNKEFDKFARRVSESQIDSDLATMLGGTEAKAKRFNQQLEKIVASMADKLIPAFEKLAPQLLKLAEQFGRIVQWAASNPGQAIVSAIVFSIARAGLESAFRGAIERAILGSIPRGGIPIPPGTIPPGTVPPGTIAPGAVGAAAGKAAPMAAGTAASLMAIGLLAGGTEAMALSGNIRGGTNQTGANDLTAGSVANFLFAGGAVGALGTLAGGGSLGDAAKELSVYKAGKWAYDFASDPTGDKAMNERAKAEAAAREKAAAEQAKAAQQLDGIQQALRGEVRVRVTNTQELKNAATPTIDSSGRDKQ
jgi:hypothetical protein